jgi:hypothetical protein
MSAYVIFICECSVDQPELDSYLQVARAIGVRIFTLCGATLGYLRHIVNWLANGDSRPNR